MEAVILMLVYGVTILSGVFLGYWISTKTKAPIQQFDLEVRPDEISDSFISRLFSKKDDEEMPKPNRSNAMDDDKAHAFFD